MKRDIVNQYRKIQADFWNEWGSLSKEFHLLRELHNVLKHFKENSRR